MVKKEALTFVIFGGTGDLARTKLAPAFSRLIAEGVLKKNSTFIGISRKKMTDNGYRKFLTESVKNSKEKYRFEEINVRYLAIDFSKKENIEKLAQALPFCEIDKCNRIYYLATSYKLFPEILKGLRRFGLLSKNDKFNKIVFEKPFGEDLKSSEFLKEKINEIANEKNVFRIDHYLGKESVQNILALKFGSSSLQHMMNNKHIKEIEIIVDEDQGVGSRLEYYNDFGAVKDMIQSHLLQLLALLLMDRPKKIESRYIHDEKVKTLKKISFDDVKNSLLGQYKSYGKELGKKSKTETFAKISLNCSDKKYKGVKIFLRTGKKLPRRYAKIVIKFKEPDNRIVINLQPNENVEIVINGKKLKNIDFCPECSFTPNTPDAYGVLMKEIISNDHRLFVRNDDIYESWRIVDSIEKNKNKIPFVIYSDGSDPQSP